MIARNMLLLAAGALLCIALFPTAWAGPAHGPITLTYHSCQDMEKEFGLAPIQRCLPQLPPRERAARNPPFCSKHPLVAAFSLGVAEDNTFLCALDESRGTGTGHDTAYIDQNNNEDLTDDQELTGIPNDDGRGFRFPAVEVSVSYGGQTLPYQVQCRTYGTQARRMYIHTACYLTAEIDLGGETCSLYLFDDTVNGLFNDPYTVQGGVHSYGPLRASGDSLLIDLNKDGNVQKSYNLLPEIFALGRHLCLDHQCYELNIDPTGRRLDLRLASGNFGYIVCEQRAFLVELYGADGATTVSGPATGDAPARIRIPAGDYRFGRCTLETKDDQGITWHACGRGQFQQPIVKVRKNQETTLEFGLPLSAKVSAARTQDEYRLTVAITGAGGEDYWTSAFNADGIEFCPDPRFQARDAQGKAILIDDAGHG